MRMIRRRWQVAILSTTISAAGSALAVGLRDHIWSERSPIPQVAAEETCRDFAGQWNGECVDKNDPNERTFPDSLRIDQVGCVHFRISQKDKPEETYEIGEAKRWGKTTPSTKMNTDLNQIALWSGDRDMLIISLSATSNNLSTNEHWKERGSQRVAYRSGQLIITTQIDREGIVNGTTQTNNTTLICRYSRQ